MSKEPQRAGRLLAHAFNLPNQLTGLRWALAVVMFALIGAECYLASFVFFVVAASTDWLDGYFARKYGQVTTLGRILDPFADKVIICGAFIYLAAIPEMAKIPWGLRPWMVVVIVGRELLVTALRSFLEERGADFSAKLSGKLKMVLQCVAAGAALFWLYYAQFVDPGGDHPFWMRVVLIGSIWEALILTAYSGIIYVWVALRILRGR